MVGDGRAATRVPTFPRRAVRLFGPRPPAGSSSTPTQAWAGNWLVQVSTGEGRLTTWYAHMQSLTVADGQIVQAGQQIGEVGTLGNSTGCHLHFEVHPRGGSIYEDGVDPSEWLQTHAGSGQQVQTVSSSSAVQPSTTGSSIAGPSTTGTPASGSFVLASFNVLGNSHTGPGGHHPGWANGAARMRGAINLLDRSGAEVAGLQELQRPQRQALVRLAGNRYAVYSPPGDTDNSITWRRDRWSFVSADTVPIPYFHGNIRDMPIVRLRNLATKGDAIFVNVHNPADVHGNAARFRAEAMRRELAIMRSLARYDVPAFLTGDFNAREGRLLLAHRRRHTVRVGGRFPCRSLPAPEALWDRLDLRHEALLLHRACGRPRPEACCDQRPPAGPRSGLHRRGEVSRVTEEPRYPYFGKPPAREPRPASEVPALRGKRVILSTPDGFVYDVRAISQIHQDGNGQDVIDVVAEEHYYRWMFTQVVPPTESFPSKLVWVE